MKNEIVLKIELPCDPAVPVLSTYPYNTLFRKDTCTLVLIAAAFTIVKTGKRPACSSADEWAEVCVYSRMLFSHKQSEMSFATVWWT